MRSVAVPRVLPEPERRLSGTVVFSDVDDTIIHGKSLVGFAEHLACSLPALEAARLREALSRLLARMRGGEGRSSLNRAYYEEVLRDRSVEEMRRVADSWHREANARKDFFKAGVCELLAFAREAGAKIVLLSGSFRELLEPIANQVGASAMVAAPLERCNGRYTGRLIGSPTVEGGKADAMREYTRREGIALSECFGVGDDLADLPFLELVGWRFVPADAQPEMAQQARARHWCVLSGSLASDVANYFP
jgi:HAD superfamily hydrolase (TIGR01490 family)